MEVKGNAFIVWVNYQQKFTQDGTHSRYLLHKKITSEYSSNFCYETQIKIKLLYFEWNENFINTNKERAPDGPASTLKKTRKIRATGRTKYVLQENHE